jgi:multiple sugar transport system substrate-binding protein
LNKDQVPSAEQEVMSLLEEKAIWRHVLQLPMKLREILLLQIHHELTISDMAAILHISQGTVKSRLHMNNKATRVTMDSKAWNHVFQLALDGYQSGLFHKRATFTNENNPVEPSVLKAMDLFTQGKAAMTLDSIEYYNRTSEKTLGFEVGIVTAPVSQAQPNINTFFSNRSIFAINAKASNPDAVWEVIKYINSEAVAKLRIQTNSGLTTHLSVLNDLKYKNLDAFYKMDSSSSSLYDFPYHLKMDFVQSFNFIIEEEIAKVMNGKQTVDEAQVNIQQREQNKLDKANSK